MNRLQLKALMLSVITELKFGQPLDRRAAGPKKQFKQMVGLGARASNKAVLKAIGDVYKANNLEEDFNACIAKFKAEKYLA